MFAQQFKCETDQYTMLDWLLFCQANKFIHSFIQSIWAGEKGGLQKYASRGVRRRGVTGLKPLPPPKSPEKNYLLIQIRSNRRLML